MNRVNPSKVHPGDKVTYVAATRAPFFTDCTDPRPMLTPESEYTIAGIHVFKLHTVFSVR